jgi:hypothetical protein
MVMGITGKKLLWRVPAASNLPRKGNIDFVEMEQHAEQQIARVLD